MFQKYKKIGILLLGFGAGMLFACLFQSGALCVIGGIVFLVAGILLMRKY